MLKHAYWLVLLLLAAGTTWLLWRLEKDVIHEETVLKIPDYTLKRFTTRKMNAEGQLAYQLNAQSLRHFKNSNTQIDAPVMIFYEQQQPRWKVIAEHGDITPDFRHLWLRGQTRIEAYNAAQERVLDILSRDVFVDLEHNIAETSYPTQITHFNGVTHSIGMRALLPQQQIRLFSKVRGRYAKQ